MKVQAAAKHRAEPVASPRPERSRRRGVKVSTTPTSSAETMAVISMVGT